jgi:hypothetical protein
VVHGRSCEPVRLEASAEGTRLYVEVRDGGAGVPATVSLRPTPARASGRGLAMVRGLADARGIRRRPGRVWFEMDLGRTDATLPSRRPASR